MSKDVVLHPFLSRAGEGEILVMSGLKLRIGSTQTGGAFEVVELGGTGSPPPHIHQNHDECFYVIKGLFTFGVGEEKVEAPAGSVIFIPHGTPHGFQHSEGAQALAFVIPAQLEGFFRELGEGLAAGRLESDLRAELAGKYDSWPVR